VARKCNDRMMTTKKLTVEKKAHQLDWWAFSIAKIYNITAME
jgi:hypothetical protein